VSPSERVQYRNVVWNSDRWDGFELRSDDVIISTAPKCGTTWMQMQVALLLFRDPDLPAPLATLSPWLEMNTRPLAEVVADLDGQTHRRFIKTHTPLDGLPWADGVTYLHVARDPRDVAQSWDNHMENMNMERFIESRAASVGLDDLAELGIEGMPPPPPDDPAERFWLWVEGDSLSSLVHPSATFWAAPDRPNVHLSHYGDQLADLTTEMTRLADALGVDPPTAALVDAAQFETMKTRSSELMPNSDISLFHDSRQFFDKARAGEWRELMAEGGAARYDAAVRRASDDDDLLTWLHAGPLP
jgi:hypothetical protein